MISLYRLKSLKKAFTMVEVLIVIAIVAILAALIIPEVRMASVESSGKAESDNLRTIQAAKLAWMKDHPGADLPTVVADAKAALSPYLAYGWPVSPWGTEYAGITDVNSPVTSPVNGDAKYEPTGGLGGNDTFSNGYNDLGFSKNVYLVAPNVTGTWASGNFSTPIPPVIPPTVNWTLSLAVDPVGSGILMGAGSYENGNSTTFSVTPFDNTWTFAYWDGDLVGKAQSDSIWGLPDRSGTAHMQRVTHTLSAQANPAAYGTVTPSSPETHVHGSIASVTATANPGYKLTAWGGDLSGSVPTIAAGGSSGSVTGLTMLTDRSVTASFVAQMANITVSHQIVNNTGGALPNSSFSLLLSGPGGFTRNINSTHLGGNSSFSGLSLGDYTLSQTSAPADWVSSGSVTVNANSESTFVLSITNTFSPTRVLHLTIQNNTTGTVVPFVRGWSAVGSWVGESGYSIPASSSQVVDFTIPSGVVNVWVGPDATKGSNFTTFVPVSGLSAIIPADPGKGGAWTPAISELGSSNINASIRIEPVPPNYDLTLVSSPAGAATMVGGGTFVSGSSQTIGFTKTNSKYSFIGWSGNATGNSNPYTVSMDGNKTITANFLEIAKTASSFETNVAQPGETFTITVSNNSGLEAWPVVITDTLPVGVASTYSSSPLPRNLPSWDGVGAWDGSETFVLSGNTVTWTGTVAVGEYVSVCIPYTITQVGAFTNNATVGDGFAVASVTGVAVPGFTLNLTSSPPGGGAPSRTDDPYPHTYTDIPMNTDVPVEARPNPGWMFSSWSGDVTSVGGTPAGKGHVVMTSNKSGTANFVEAHTLTVHSSGPLGVDNPAYGQVFGNAFLLPNNVVISFRPTGMSEVGSSSNATTGSYCSVRLSSSTYVFGCLPSVGYSVEGYTVDGAAMQPFPGSGTVGSGFDMTKDHNVVIYFQEMVSLLFGAQTQALNGVTLGGEFIKLWEYNPFTKSWTLLSSTSVATKQVDVIKGALYWVTYGATSTATATYDGTLSNSSKLMEMEAGIQSSFVQNTNDVTQFMLLDNVDFTQGSAVTKTSLYDAESVAASTIHARYAFYTGTGTPATTDYSSAGFDTAHLAVGTAWNDYTIAKLVSGSSSAAALTALATYNNSLSALLTATKADYLSATSAVSSSWGTYAGNLGLYGASDPRTRAALTAYTYDQAKSNAVTDYWNSLQDFLVVKDTASWTATIHPGNSISSSGSFYFTADSSMTFRMMFSTPLLVDLNGDGKPSLLAGGGWERNRRGSTEFKNFRMVALDDQDPAMWEWVGPDDGLLVYLPGLQGTPTGKNLFGGDTFGKKWDNGFEALKTLDVNHDGIISGLELNEIGVWQDKNTNGILDDGELLLAKDAGITELALSYKGGNDAPQSQAKVKGKRVKVWDWWSVKTTSQPVAVFVWSLGSKKITRSNIPGDWEPLPMLNRGILEVSQDGSGQFFVKTITEQGGMRNVFVYPAVRTTTGLAWGDSKSHILNSLSSLDGDLVGVTRVGGTAAKEQVGIWTPKLVSGSMDGIFPK